MVQYLWQVHYQILSIIVRKTKCKYEHYDKKCQTHRIKKSIGTVFSNTQTLKMA